LIESEENVYFTAIQNIDKPILFVNGELDARKAGSLVASITQTLKCFPEVKFLNAAQTGKLHVVKGATHLLPLEPNHNTELNEIILEFARQIGW
jgi:pimeloyl-ACP methyl ester carboxylesterase